LPPLEACTHPFFSVLKQWHLQYQKSYHQLGASSCGWFLCI
jgi:hypothetical protein